MTIGIDSSSMSKRLGLTEKLLVTAKFVFLKCHLCGTVFIRLNLTSSTYNVLLVGDITEMCRQSVLGCCVKDKCKLN